MYIKIQGFPISIIVQHRLLHRCIILTVVSDNIGLVWKPRMVHVHPNHPPIHFVAPTIIRLVPRAFYTIHILQFEEFVLSLGLRQDVGNIQRETASVCCEYRNRTASKEFLHNLLHTALYEMRNSLQVASVPFST